MPLTLVSTAGSASANAYASLSDVDTVAREQFPVPTWSGNDDTDTKARAIITATRQLDRLRWVGERVDTVQALEWPRTGAPTPTGGEHAYDAIPAPVIRATSLLAIWLLDQDGDPFAVADGAGITSMDLGGDLRLSFGDGAGSVPAGASYLRSTVYPVLRGLALTQPRVVRG